MLIMQDNRTPCIGPDVPQLGVGVTASPLSPCPLLTRLRPLMTQEGGTGTEGRNGGSDSALPFSLEGTAGKWLGPLRPGHLKTLLKK